MAYTEKHKLGGDGRMDTPAFHRNYTFILDVLQQHLSDQTGHLLEIGSGSGQHAVEYAKTFEELSVWPSDLNPAHLKSINAWRDVSMLKNIQDAFVLDVTDATWSIPTTPSAIISLNMIHISPFDATEGLFRGAGQVLSKDGQLFLYGPFKEGGQHTAPSNAEFDASLQARYPSWGVRDIDDLQALAVVNGLRLVERVTMPSNNQTLVFLRS